MFALVLAAVWGKYTGSQLGAGRQGKAVGENTHNRVTLTPLLSNIWTFVYFSSLRTITDPGIDFVYHTLHMPVLIEKLSYGMKQSLLFTSKTFV